MTRLALPNSNVNKHEQNSVTDEAFWQLYITILVRNSPFDFTTVVLTLFQVAVEIFVQF